MKIFKSPPKPVDPPKDTKLLLKLKKPAMDETTRKRVEALARARAEKKLRSEQGEVDKRRNPMEVWEDDPLSMRKAINANCFDCIGAENYRNRIRYCSMFKCPFWGLRPYSKGITKEQCEKWVEDSKPVKEEE